MLKLCFPLAILFLSVPFLANCQKVISLSQDKELKHIGSFTQYYLDAEYLPIDEILRPEVQKKFTNYHQKIPNFASTSKSAWLKFKVQEQQPGPYYLEVGSAFMDSISLYKHTDSGPKLLRLSGDELKFGSREIDVTTFIFKLDTAPNQINTYYLKVKSLQPLFFPLRVGKLEAFMEDAHLLDHLQGVYFGFMLLIMLYNLFLYFSTKENIYLYYIAYIFSVTLFMSFIYQTGFEYVWPNLPIINRFAVISSSLTIFTAVIFSQKFLQTKQYAPKLHRFSYIFIGAAFLITILTFSPYKILALQIAQGSILLMSIFFLFLGFKSYRNGNKTAKFYLFAWGFLIIGFILAILESLNAIPVLHYINSIQIGSAIEALLLSLALGDRINIYKRQKVEAQEQALDAAKKNAKLIQEQNIILENKVAARTQELSETLLLVDEEKQKSENLLLNILPMETANELRENGKATPRNHEFVTVLFADIVGFSQIAKIMSAKELVANLDDIFQAFDLIVQENGLEKIKTIGDAYMAAGGIPVSNKTHPNDALQAAMQMLAFIENRNTKHDIPFEIRCGIHTGPVIAGVVGRDKFAYDIWGPTVNLASRMERASKPGKVNISESTLKFVSENKAFQFQARGKIEVKGEGAIEMFFAAYESEQLKSIDRISDRFV